MLHADLQSLGLTDEESKVYLAVLELGGAYVSAIAKKANVHRVSCYHTLGNLVTKGLISSLIRNNMKYFSVESPKVLVNQLEEKYHKAQELLPELLSLTNSLAYKPKIQYYEGLNGLQNIMEDTLNSEGEVLGYTNLAALPGVLPEEYIRRYAKNKIDKKIKSRMLSPISDDALEYIEKYYPNYDETIELIEILFINPNEFMIEYEINIYEDKVSIISLSSQEIIGLILQSPVYARTQRAIFNLAWLGATSFVAR
jgi:sugar-specific transcriptional regulator TrmB